MQRHPVALGLLFALAICHVKGQRGRTDCGRVRRACRLGCFNKAPIPCASPVGICGVVRGGATNDNNNNSQSTNRPITIPYRLPAKEEDYNDQVSREVASTSESVQPKTDVDAALFPASGTYKYNPLRMYRSCMVIVMVWITTGTLFYAYCNDWPLPQSFFYSVDAGMSIGFCTDVYEVKLVSKAFTILYILLGASVVGGALALFIQSSMENLHEPSIQEYRVLLEKQAFDKADVDRTGTLGYEEFEALIRSSSVTNGGGEQGGGELSSEDVRLLWTQFDRLKDGVIHLKEFVGTYRGIQGLVQSLKAQHQNHRWIHRFWARLKHTWSRIWNVEHRIYIVFVLWVAMGVIWGMVDQGWDIITATHFAISALATGGLTAPDVNEAGILPAEPAIFCGIFCLLGIPLMAVTLGHFAQSLVSGHVKELEEKALSRPMTKAEYELAARLTTDRDSVVHLSDFVVLQLLRQGKLTVENIEVLKRNFELLDTDQSGKLTLEEATAPRVTHPSSANKE